LLIIGPTCVVIDLASPEVLLVDGKIDTVQSSSSLAARPPAQDVPASILFLPSTRSCLCPLSGSFFSSEGLAPRHPHCDSSVTCADVPPAPPRSRVPAANTALSMIRSPTPTHTRGTTRARCTSHACMHAGTSPNHLPHLRMRVAEVSAGLGRRHDDPRLQ
jgi:hypothetical protein